MLHASAKRLRISRVMISTTPSGLLMVRARVDELISERSLAGHDSTAAQVLERADTEVTKCGS